MTTTIKASLHRLLGILRKYFVTGLLLFIPFYLTFRLLLWGFRNIDDVPQPIVEFFVGHKIAGVGFVVTILIIFIFGILGAKVLGRQLIRLWESMVQKPPLIRHIYSAVKQIIDSFTSKEKGGFRQVVIVEFPRKDMWTLGLITSESPDPTGQIWVSLYIPTPPNPTGGFFAILREEEVIRTKIPIDLALKIIISSGKLTEDVIFEHLAKYRAEMEKKAGHPALLASACSPLTEREVKEECAPLGSREPGK